jgi:DNA ligase-1
MKPTLASEPDPRYPLTTPKYGSPKLDGIRGLTTRGTLLSRSHKEIPNAAIRAQLAPFQELDGELIWGEPTSPTVYHDTFSAVMKKEGLVEGLKFYAFDVLHRTWTYQERLDSLLQRNLPEWFVILPQTLIHSEQELAEFYANNLELGYEGAILRNPTALYKEGRCTAKSQDMLKMKPFLDSDAVILGVFEAMENNNPAFRNELGQTNRSTWAAGLVPKGMIGGFNCEYEGKPFKVAAGRLSHAERIQIWEHRQQFIGALMTYRHLPIGQKDVPRHARFIKWRSSIDV